MKELKRVFSAGLLACAVLLLSACPDSKLPNPSPKVPEPKAVDAKPRSTDKINLQAGGLVKGPAAALHRA